MTRHRLTYFDAPGRAEPVRIAFFLVGIPFEDRRVTFSEFMGMKQRGELPLGSLPVLEIEGRPMVQTAAMLRYVARLGDGTLYPNDPYAALVVDSVIDTFNDTVSHALTPSLFERDQAKKLEMRRALVAGPLTLALRYVEGLLAASPGPFLTGTALTVGDILLGVNIQSYRSGALDGIGPEVLEPYPRIRALAEAYTAHPGIVAYGRQTTT
jgi:glutathione S-transferase